MGGLGLPGYFATFNLQRLFCAALLIWDIFIHSFHLNILFVDSSMVEAEVVVISEEEEESASIDMMLEEDDQQDAPRSASASSLLKLESFKFLRVLLVEFDDSTRSIIGALLRKSGYRVVSVPDGLKAWETLKGRPQTIDLVLAEVELPSISGFSLLTMIMGDEICRNIPVIMMSSYDADNVVFNCMLRGAVDFLVKPVRKNELRNLWQHVWRRNSVNSVGQSHPQNGSNSKRKNQAIDESSSTKHSSHCVSSHRQNKECSEKGSDAQSSCTKPDMEDENTDMPTMQNHFQLKSSTETSYERESVKVDDIVLMNENEVEDKSVRLVSEVEPCNQSNCPVVLTPAEEHADARIMTQGIEDANIPTDTFYGKDDQLKPSREAMDLIGSFDNHLPTYNTHFQESASNNLNTYFHPNSTRNNCSSTPRLELSLRRSHFSDDEIRGVGEIKRLKHSNASAFSRYNQQTVQSPVCTESKECASVSCIHQSDHALSHAAEVPRHGVISVPLPVRSTKVDGLYGAVWPQLFYTPVRPLPLQSSKSATQQEAVFHVYSSDQSNPEIHDHQQSNCKSTNTTMHVQHHNVESFDDSRRVSVSTSVTSSLCNSSSSNINSSGCGSVCDGSNGNENAFTIAGAANTGRRNDLGIFMPDGIRGTDSHCSNQREAALTKFRLKRKDRCFDKKVRYQSRKRLAEQRPRVKGQFVRQIPS